MSDSVDNIAALRLCSVEGWLPGGAPHHGVFPSGHTLLDAYLDGGFQRGQLHEVLADSAEDNGSAAGFAAMLGLLGLQPGKSILWLRTIAATRKGGRFNPAGLAELGGDPSRVLVAVACDETALLRSARDALRCNGFAVVIIECWGSPAILDLTAFRRLTLAADRSGVTAVMLRLGAREQLSTASTRWAVRSAPSDPLEANAPGYPALDLTLLRRRAGPFGKSWLVEWNRDATCFRECTRQTGAASTGRKAAFPGAVVPLPGIGQAAAREPARHIA